MICLVYVSSALELFDAPALDALLEECRMPNAAADITGVLFYADGNILQVLEGEKTAVEDLFRRIKRDRRHHNVLKLYEKSITQRQFGRWSMALARPEMLGDVEGVESIAFVRRSLEEPVESATGDDVRLLLQVFVDNMR